MTASECLAAAADHSIVTAYSYSSASSECWLYVEGKTLENSVANQPWIAGKNDHTSTGRIGCTYKPGRFGEFKCYLRKDRT